MSGDLGEFRRNVSLNESDFDFDMQAGVAELEYNQICKEQLQPLAEYLATVVGKGTSAYFEVGGICTTDKADKRALVSPLHRYMSMKGTLSEHWSFARVTVTSQHTRPGVQRPIVSDSFVIRPDELSRGIIWRQSTIERVETDGSSEWQFTADAAPVIFRQTKDSGDPDKPVNIKLQLGARHEKEIRKLPIEDSRRRLEAAKRLAELAPVISSAYQFKAGAIDKRMTYPSPPRLWSKRKR